MRTPTEQDYNAESREIEFCIDIYFNGLNSDPLRVTRDNYLIDLDLLDEACTDGDTFIGVPSSNEVSFNLYDDNGLFNPNNTSGTYYGKINLGVCLKVYVRPIIAEEELTFDPLGVFYVTDWVTDLTGINVSVSGTDSLQALFTSDRVCLPIKRNYSVVNLLTDFFTANNISIITKGTLDQILPFAYIDKDNNEFLQEIAIGALLFIYNNHLGETVVQALNTAASVLYTLTDSDQIISISAKQSIVNSYDGITIVCEQPQLSEEQVVLQNREQELTGNETLSVNKQGFSITPLYEISRVEIQSDADCDVVVTDCNVYDISYQLINRISSAIKLNVTFLGYIIECLTLTFTDDTSSVLKIDNIYIQTETQAMAVKNTLNSYINLTIPVLEVVIRGNPKYQPGDKVRIYSENYNIDFVGWVLRQEYKYDGGLSAKLTVLKVL